MVFRNVFIIIFLFIPSIQILYLHLIIKLGILKKPTDFEIALLGGNHENLTSKISKKR